MFVLRNSHRTLASFHLAEPYYSSHVQFKTLPLDMKASILIITTEDLKLYMLHREGIGWGANVRAWKLIFALRLTCQENPAMSLTTLWHNRQRKSYSMQKTLKHCFSRLIGYSSSIRWDLDPKSWKEMQDITKKEMFSKWKVEVKDVKWFWGSGC